MTRFIKIVTSHNRTSFSISLIFLSSCQTDSEFGRTCSLLYIYNREKWTELINYSIVADLRIDFCIHYIHVLYTDALAAFESSVLPF